MELHLAPQTEAKLQELSRRTNKGTDELLGEAVDYLVEYNEWFRRDDDGEYYHLITAWKATKEEQQNYAENI